MICKRCNQKFRDNSAIIGVCSKCREMTMELQKLEIDILKCNKCDLYKQITHKVVYRGNKLGQILLVGEAPGRNEDEYGIPFCGAAGQVLDTLLKQSELPESSYIITNVLHCRPPGNRVPTPQEREACSPFLKRFIELIDPVVIVPLGMTAIKAVWDILEISDKITSMGAMHGRCYFKKLPGTENNLKIIPIYHPAAILYNRELFDDALADFQWVDQVIR